MGKCKLGKWRTNRSVWSLQAWCAVQGRRYVSLIKTKQNMHGLLRYTDFRPSATCTGSSSSVLTMRLSLFDLMYNSGNKKFKVIQGRWFLVQIESAYATSYLSPIATMVLSCTVSQIRRLIGWKLRIFPTPLSFGASAPCVPFGISRWS